LKYGEPYAGVAAEAVTAAAYDLQTVVPDYEVQMNHLFSEGILLSCLIKCNKNTILKSVLLQSNNWQLCIKKTSRQFQLNTQAYSQNEKKELRHMMLGYMENYNSIFIISLE